MTDVRIKTPDEALRNFVATSFTNECAKLSDYRTLHAAYLAAELDAKLQREVADKLAAITLVQDDKIEALRAQLTQQRERVLKQNFTTEAEGDAYMCGYFEAKDEMSQSAEGVEAKGG